MPIPIISVVDKINVIAQGYVLTVYKVIVSSANMITAMIYVPISSLHQYASIHRVSPMSATIAKTCKLPKVFYMADVAQKQRDDNVSSWKEGPKKLRYVKMELAGHAYSTVIQWPLGRKEV